MSIVEYPKNPNAVIVTLAVLVTLGMFMQPKMSFADKKPVVLRLVIATPEGNWPMTFRDKKMAKKFNERTKNEYVIEVHTGGAMAKLPEFFDAVRIGAVEMAASPWGMFLFLEPSLSLLEMPFLFANDLTANSACRVGIKILAFAGFLIDFDPDEVELSFCFTS